MDVFFTPGSDKYAYRIPFIYVIVGGGANITGSAIESPGNTFVSYCQEGIGNNWLFGQLEDLLFDITRCELQPCGKTAPVRQS